MVTPTKEKILQRAKRMDLYEGIMKGLPAITPEEHELKETGAMQRATIDLMTSERTRARSQMRQYLEDMAKELNVRIVSGPEFRKFERWMLTPVQRIVKKTEPPKHRIRDRVPAPVPVPKVIKDQTSIGIKLPGMPTRVKGTKKAPKIRVQIPGVGKPSKKVRKPTRSRTMRSLRKINGVKVFSFPDHVWKVRELGSRRKGRKR
jgi:hypothetical protein